MAGLLILLLAGCDASSARPDGAVDERPAVRVGDVRSAPGQERHRFPGVVRATQRASPAFLHAGVLAVREVERGQRVARGEPLAVLHNPAMAPARSAAEGQVRELEARIGQLRRDLERARSLRDGAHIAESELDRLQADLEATRQAREQAVARRTEASAQVDELMLRAPFDAHVIDLLVEPGDFIGAGEPVLELAGVAGREVEIRVPSRLAERLEPGAAVEVASTLGAGRVAGRIASVGRAGAGLAPVVVHLEADVGPALGEPVQVQLAVAASESLQVPLTAVLDPGGHAPHVLALEEDGTVRRVAVVAGRLADGWVSVDAGLAVGERVVVAGQGRLSDGQRVRVLP